MEDKLIGNYKNLKLSNIILETDIISFAEFVEEILAYKNSTLEGSRIDVSFEPGIISKYNDIPCDVFNITLYRDGEELEKGYTSNYIYTEFDNFRCLWIDLYYSKKDYDSDKVFKDIIREINNFKNRDFQEYLDTL